MPPQEIRKQIREQLERLFVPPERDCDEPVPEGFPERNEELQRWLGSELPDLGQTPEAVLEGGDENSLLLLARFANAIATSRALSHPNVVRAILRRRIEDLLERCGTIEPLVRELTDMQPEATPEELFRGFTRWMAFDKDPVDASRLQYASGLLDAIDGGAFS